MRWKMRKSAPVSKGPQSTGGQAAERLSVLLNEERAEATEELMSGIKDDIVHVLHRRTKVPIADIAVRFDRRSGMNCIEIDMTMPVIRRAASARGASTRR